MKENIQKKVLSLNQPLISVLMSTYNETLDELQQSVSSILNQSYKNIEFIIVNDNPRNKKLHDFLLNQKDSRIKVIENEENIGLVRSLNEALRVAKGEYIARMDADDISEYSRLEEQLDYLKKNNLDIVGSLIKTIDENGAETGCIHFPEKQAEIKFFLKWGNCLAHPTWFAKKSVFLKLKGYRNIPRCEDYDFINRAIKKGIRVGNIQRILLRYRIRKESVSKSGEIEQYVLRAYLSKNRNEILSQDEINEFLKSKDFIVKCQELSEFQKVKSNLKIRLSVKAVCKLITNRFFIPLTVEHIVLKFR